MASVGTHVTGSFAAVASVYCIWINMCHLYLTKNSAYRKTTFGRKLLFWSHLSMIFVTISPICIVFSYTHVEQMAFIYEWTHNDCLCAFWYALAMVTFETGFVFLCVNYLVRLNLVLHPTDPDRKSPVIVGAIILLICEAIVVDATLFVATHGECNPNHDLGCVASFEEWGM